MKAVAVVLGTLGLFAAIVLGMYFSANNSATRMEREIVARADNVDNVLSNYGQKVQEAAQVPNMQTESLKEVMKAAFEGRYGEDGSKATWQWIQENYPGQVDNQLYRQLQQIIESGRNDFANEQKQLIDAKRVYLTSLDTLPGGWMKQLAGFPKINVGYNGGADDYKVIITNRAADARSTGREDGPIQLTPSK